MSRARPLSWFLAALALLAVLAAGAFAQEGVGSRRMGVRFEGSLPHLSFSARDLVTADVRRKLQSGLPQTIVLRIYAYTDGGRRPITIAPRQCRVVYDLWEEVYRVQIATADGDRSESVATLDAVASKCLVVRNMAVGTAEEYRSRSGQRVYFAVLVELNPLSPDTVQRIRRWLARGGGRFDNDAFFGSFVSLFVNRRIGEAERTLRFRSQSVEVP